MLGIDLLAIGSLHPWFIPAALLIGTFVLEDAAIVSGAMLVSEGVIGAESAFVALVLGIVSGDLLLYLAGYYSARNRFLRSWLHKDKMIAAGRWLTSYLFLTILLVRFAPG